MQTAISRKTKIVFLCAALAATGGSFRVLQANPTLPENEQKLVLPEMLAQQAFSENPQDANDAIQALRKQGPGAMFVLSIAARSTLVGASANPERRQTEEWKRVANAFEKVGAQHDNWASHLYWFTDLEAAKAEAQKQNKPILSLRLLGNLDEELSCANSRFFRTALYPNANISKMLRENYILHWESVRPVPKVTIDFGDGRKIQTTITGNSIHYILDAQGRVLDALPGLYGPAAFARWLERVQDVNTQSIKLEGAVRETYLKNFHQNRSAEIMTNWQKDTRGSFFVSNPIRMISPFNPPNNVIQNARQTAKLTASPFANTQQKTNAQQLPVLGNQNFFPPTARNAGFNPASKIAYESRTLQAVTIPIPRDRGALSLQTDDALWKSVAAKHASDAKLDVGALEVLRTKSAHPQTVAATFEKTIAEDTVRNEYSRHTTIHEWLAANPNPDLKQLNTRVYAELFLTPDSDPWLGLLPEDAYSGIRDDGVISSQ